jgi:hypothetical protein
MLALLAIGFRKPLAIVSLVIVFLVGAIVRRRMCWLFLLVCGNTHETLEAKLF